MKESLSGKDGIRFQKSALEDLRNVVLGCMVNLLQSTQLNTIYRKGVRVTKEDIIHALAIGQKECYHIFKSEDIPTELQARSENGSISLYKTPHGRGITMGHIKRIGFQAGIKTMSNKPELKEIVNNVLSTLVYGVLRSSFLFMEHARRKTISLEDVHQSAERLDMKIYSAELKISKKKKNLKKIRQRRSLWPA